MRTRRRRCCLFVEMKRALDRVFVRGMLGSLAALLSKEISRPPTPHLILDTRPDLEGFPSAVEKT